MNSKVVHCFFHDKPTKPFSSSSSRINAKIQLLFKEQGYDVYSFHKRDMKNEKKYEPLEYVNRMNTLMSLPKPHIALYCDKGLFMQIPERGRRCKNVLYFHGLLYNANIWMNYKLFDLYCTNSLYTKNVITSLFSSLLRVNRSQNYNIYDKVFEIAPPLSIIEDPDGDDSFGTNLNDDVITALKDDNIYGHCLHGEKADIVSVYWIMYYLNKFAEEQWSNKRYRLFIFFRDFMKLKRLQEIIEIKLPIEKYFIPLPFLKNSELVKLMKSSRFCLCYNYEPESFGIYPLESIYNNCPVYTNGIGNYRYLLPERSGLYRYENEAMVFGKSSEYRYIAELIHNNNNNFQSILDDCKKGREYIQKNYGVKNFKTKFINMLDVLEKTKRNEDGEPYDLFFCLSPFVRSWNEKTGRIISDIGNHELTEDGNNLLKEILNKKIDNIFSPSEAEIREHVDSLIYKGILSITKP